MPRYSVAIPWHATVIVEVEAENEEQAEEKAYARAHGSVCAYCSKHVQMEDANDAEIPDVQEIP